MRVAAGVAVSVFFVWAVGRAVDAEYASAEGEPPDVVYVDVDRTVGGRNVDRWREIALLRDLTARRQARIIRAQRRALRYDSNVVEAINLASATWGVSGATLWRKATCESRLRSYARNRSSRASGLFQFLPSTFASTPYARFSIFSPYANALAAGWMHRVGRGGEWVCR